MKRLLLLSALVCFFSVVSQAQVPIVQVYLDENLTVTNPHSGCPPFGTVDTLYVVASGFATLISDIEYSIDAHANFDFALEQFPPGFTGVGLTAEGVAISFGGPINASAKVIVETIVGLWYCDCGSLKFPYITVGPHSGSGKIQASRWPDMMKIEATGGYNSLCPVLPTEPSSWGRIKALYR